MIDSSIAQVQEVVIHLVVSGAEGHGLHLAENSVDIHDDGLRELLLRNFVQPFKTDELFRFSFSNGNPQMNPVFQYCAQILEQPERFLPNSEDIAKHLSQASGHPNIKSGELFITRIKDLELRGERCDAVGIFKSEVKADFLDVSHRDKQASLRRLRGIAGMDKGCLVFNTERGDGFRVCLFDVNGRQGETRFWKDDFLGLQRLNDNVWATEALMMSTRDFIMKDLPKHVEVDKLEQATLLKRANDYFQTEEEYSRDSFEDRVLGHDGLKSLYGSYQQELVDEQGEALQFDDGVAFSQEAVKRFSRKFRSVIKLDKNFHLYVHGDESRIERGYDEDRGMSYYKVFFESES